ncbi:hypothetical protein H6H01_16120 [Nostoc calcicola FACHB-3891]|nr:hypothetical protein [Nostoc calcicola FACHB-3891]
MAVAVHLKDFLLVFFDIQSGDLLKAIEMAIPAFAIEQAMSSLDGDAARTASR